MYAHVTEMTVTYLMPSTSVVLLAELLCVKVAGISPDICNKFNCMGGWMNDIKKQASGQSRQDSFLLTHSGEEVLLPVERNFLVEIQHFQ